MVRFIPGAWRAALSGLLLAAFAAHAHDLTGSAIHVDLGQSRARLEAEVPLDELRAALGVTEEDALVDYVRQHLTVQSADGRPFALDFEWLGLSTQNDRSWARVGINATPPESAGARDFIITSDLIIHHEPSHRVFVFVRHDVRTGLDAPLLHEVLNEQRQQTRLHRPDGSTARAFTTAFGLGLGHIAEGTDHLLFLFTLLLPASLASSAGRWRNRKPGRTAALDMLRTVTAFTIGHSLTLLLGALGAARVPSAFVESLIAFSIMVSAVHALRPLFPRREGWVALLFGLVHGLGFASALEGLGVDGVTLAVTVAGFNLGVEVMQAALVAVTLPWFFVLSGTRTGPAFRQGGAVVAFIFGAAWLAERALSLESPLPALADWLFSPWLLAGLALLTLFARVSDSRSDRPDAPHT